MSNTSGRKNPPRKIDQCAPRGYNLFPHQVEALHKVEEAWPKHDVIILQSPVGSGKSVLAQTMARWARQFGRSAATITPRVLLQNQYETSFPEVLNVKGVSRYECETHEGMSCSTAIDTFEVACPDCPYRKAMAQVHSSKNIVCNFHSFVIHEVRKNILIIDEAHTTFDFLQDYTTLRFWEDKYDFPKDTPTYGEVAIWCEREIKKLTQERAEISYNMEIARAAVESSKGKKKLHKEAIQALSELGKLNNENKKNLGRFRFVLDAITKCPEPFFVERTKEMRDDVELEVIKMRPRTMEGLPALLWGNHVEKIILMSGTIHEIDLVKLGLGGKRAITIECPNAIPAANRPIVPLTNCNMSYAYKEKNAPVLAKIIEEIMNRHKDTKGVVHVTYSTARDLGRYIKDKRVWFHNNQNKDEVFKLFMESTDNPVLIACGMAEGIDLAGPRFGWQIITKIMYPNKSDPLINEMYTRDPEYVTWSAAKTTIQQTGRICRGVADYGVTYITDTAFGNPVKRQGGLFQKAQKFWSKDWVESIQWEMGSRLSNDINQAIRGTT